MMVPSAWRSAHPLYLVHLVVPVPVELGGVTIDGSQEGSAPVTGEESGNSPTPGSKSMKASPIMSR